MPKGPQGQKRPADVIGAAVMVARIATGEMPNDAESEMASQREGGRKGAEIRTQTTPRERRVEIARRAAAVRWSEGVAAREKKEPQEQ